MPEPSKSGQRLEISAEAHPGGWLIRLSGVIDEHFDRQQIVEGRQGVVVLDLDGVRRITSFGIREWVTAMREAQAAVFFVRCRPAIVSQFNMVANFAGRGQLVSLYAPYRCPSCERELEVLIDRRRQSGAALSASEVHCPDCRAEMELDDIPETFFSYALVAPPPLVPPPAEAIIDGPPASSLSRLRVEKEVQGDVTVLWLNGPLDRSAHLKRAAEGLEGTVVAVLAGVRSANEEGLARLRHLTEAEDAQIYLASVPAEIARALRGAPEALGRARVISVLISAPCPACERRVEIDADLAQLQAMAGSAPQPCPTCGGPLGSPRVDQLRDALRLPLEAAPPEVRACSLRAPSAQVGAAAEGTPTFPWASAAPGALSITPPPTRVTPSPARATPSPTALDEGPPTEPSPTPSRFRRYEILRRIATGGMGSVYLGRVIGAGGFERRVAIKAMHPHIAGESSFVAMFLDEARLAARIHHPNVVATLDIDETEDGLFIVMEYIEGVTVRQINHALRARRAVAPLPVSLRVVLDALAGLHAAHELASAEGAPLQLVHRDVSPANLIVGVDGLTRITDFGIARAEERLGETTRTGEIKGRVGYMSPEQLRGAPVDRRSDVYSAGVVLWELLTAQRAFPGDNEAAVLMAALRGVSRPPSELDPRVPDEISAACMMALTQEPGLRHASAAEFAEELERAARAAGVAVATAREVSSLVREVMAARKDKDAGR